MEDCTHIYKRNALKLIKLIAFRVKRSTNIYKSMLTSVKRNAQLFLVVTITLRSLHEWHTTIYSATIQICKLR